MGMRKVRKLTASLKRRRRQQKTRKHKGGEQKKVIVSMTTTPARIDKLKDVIDNVLKQNYPIDHIEINVPLYNIRTKEPYTIPEWLPQMDKVKIHRTPDYGPITKIAPTLLRYSGDPSIYIWAIDDDHLHSPDTLKLLVNESAPNKVVGYQAFNFDNNLNVIFSDGNYQGPVQILEAWGSILYPPLIIKNDFYSYLENTLQHADAMGQDDLVLSNYFAKYKIERFKLSIAAVISGRVELPQSSDVTALRALPTGNYMRAKNAYEWLKGRNMGWL